MLLIKSAYSPEMILMHGVNLKFNHHLQLLDLCWWVSLFIQVGGFN